MSAVKNVIKDNYNMMLLKDYLREAIKDAGFSHAEISKTPVGTRVALHVTRPGIVIGRKGSGIRSLTDKLATDFGLKNPQISVVEIEKPELAPSVMCNRMASHLERGTAFRRATMWTLKQIMEGGAMGVQITISGKLRGDRSAFEKHTQGILPRAGHHAEIVVDEDIAHVQTAMGLIGIRIRIARKERLIPEFEMRTEKSRKERQAKADKIKIEEIDVEGAKVEVVKAKGKLDKARSESERIALEAKKMEELETMEEEEAKMK
ncbi:MAG: 30S ribosomal protein S3 [Nitrosopumilus sp.]|uniref:30S ribosomal protein S3 n=1 Tax=Nitrosopumilus sp. TaxID=2024843 RepID=UPI00246BBB7E|nr:30S ribosomal protein S3 [Nitrosopumilus sp.]MDH5430394.1 30S ribosomal protein S3 [Nitrosopumilus sp.]MDH5697738.1 30S ribosomal protein S3 [Nitrosopumilus sp.]